MACGETGHFKQNCPQSKRTRGDESEAPQEQSYATAVCYACGSAHHMQANCPVRHQTMECNQCHQRGHIVTTCPMTRCFNCGAFGHSSVVCHNRIHCYHCANSGHSSLECPLRHKGKLCYQCKEPGHEAANCPQGQLCRMCHRPGHYVAHCPEVTCHACHEKGHTSSVCDRTRCKVCGGGHETSHCWQQRQPTAGPPAEEAQAASDAGSDRGSAEAEPLEAPAPAVEPAPPATVAAPRYRRLDTPRKGRVAVVIDGPYFERCIVKEGLDRSEPTYYARTAEALHDVLELIGDIFRMEPIAYWFDTNPTAFVHFVETAMPLAYRPRYLQYGAQRKRHLLDEMNGDRTLGNVIPKLVGGMKQQKGFTPDGPGYVWVQTKVDVALSVAVIECFQERTSYSQVVLLSGDADLHPSVEYCNAQRRKSADYAGVPPVRVCGTSSSVAKIYGEQQDLYDFLPRILLDRPSHKEGDNTYEFAPHVLFS
ncbi:hypothetical protein STCU_08742 [Strigomonas culicis]|nr:hypothetical protein STCU_08742 [Strigomonas culicis]|eukprot:EPY20991.1 hypothetical protein STCU_08742 [Strigomonas culicis]